MYLPNIMGSGCGRVSRAENQGSNPAIVNNLEQLFTGKHED